MTGTVAFRTAIRDALDEELGRRAGDPLRRGRRRRRRGLCHDHGPVRSTAGACLRHADLRAGAGGRRVRLGVHGLRPVIEIMFGDFLTLAMDSLVNQSTKYWFLTQEQVSVPLVVRSVVGAGGRFGAIHSRCRSWFMGVPASRSSPVDPGGREGAAEGRDPRRQPGALLRAQAPVHARGRGERRTGPARRGAVVREGRDVTLVTAMKGVHDGLEAAAELEADGVSVEVVDLRTLRPFDLDTVLASVRKTNRIVVVEEGPMTGGWAGEVLASVVEHGLGHLDDAWRIATPDTPIPYSPPLEDAFLPGAGRIAQEIRARVR